MKKFHLLLILIFFPLQNILIAQSYSHVKITGRVIDASTGKPLNYVNVFIANTTLGDAADETGNYIIPNVPIGSYELIASMIGYEIQKKALQVYNSKERKINFELKPKALQREEITVAAKYPKEWKKNLKIFKRIFFGKKEFGQKCEFINPEVLDFKYDKKIGLFKAIAEAPLKLENKALGYELTIFLIEFYAELFKNDDVYIIEGNEGMPSNSQKGAFSCLSTNFFKELIPKNEKQKEKWEKNRQIAFNGSRRHFFKSLINGRLKEECFKICGTKDISGMKYTSRSDYTLNIKELLRKSENEYQYLLSFPYLLKVIYTKGKDEIQYEYGMQKIGRMPRGWDNAEAH